MSASPFDSRLFGPLLGDDEIARWFRDEAAIASMVQVERGLARAEAEAGIIPAEAARAIDKALADIEIKPDVLADGTARAGVPVPALVAALRAVLPEDAARWLHWGATSQDIVDTGLALRLDRVIAIFDHRLAVLLAALEAASQRWAGLPMAGRTRSQIAAPMAFGDRCAGWAAPLGELRADLAHLRPRLARVQLGGSVGTNSVIAPHGPTVAGGLAAELKLHASPPWHTNRVALAAFGNWCASLASAVAKMAGDLILMGRSESGEATAGSGGGSSTMPQKANPVAAEITIALGRYSGALASAMHAATIAAEERDGAAWTVEWLALPQLAHCAASALRHGTALATSIAPRPERMRAMLELDGGAAMAEAATFLLATEMPRPDAEATVKRGLALARERNTSLAAALQTIAPGTRDWESALEPARLVRRPEEGERPG